MMISVYDKETPVTVLETGQPERGLGVKMDKRAVKIIDRLLTWIYSREAGYLIAMGHPKKIEKIQEDLDDPWLTEAMEYLKDARKKGFFITRANDLYIEKHFGSGEN